MNAGCFPRTGTLPSFKQAMALVAEHTPRIDAESVPTARAFGRIAAQDVQAHQCHPPHDTSAMDGYAIATADLETGVRSFAIGNDIPAGKSEQSLVIAGTALPISTGARIPADCGAVMPLERVHIEDGRAWLHGSIRSGANIRRKGEDAVAGEIVLKAGHRVTPATMGALASYGVETIRVCRSPRIALFSTGDELGSSIPDANAPMIAGAITELGLEATCPVQLRDDRLCISDAMRAALAHAPDIIISTGGVSVGAHDHIAAVLEELGAIVYFHGVAMRPGKPLLFAHLPNGTLYFGLPGNPVAALLGFRFFVVQAIRAMLGRAAEHGIAITAPAGRKPGLTVFLKAMFNPTQDREALILDGQESHKLRPLLSADCWIMINPGGRAWAYPIECCL